MDEEVETGSRALQGVENDSTEVATRDLRDLLVDQRLNDMARRFICGEDVAAIAASYGLTAVSIRKWMSDPRFQAIYDDAKAKILGGVDAILREENIELYLRKMALAKRGVTALATGLQIAKDHVDIYGVDSKPSVIKALMDGAVAAIDRDPLVEHRKHDSTKDTPHVAVNVTLTPEKASLIRTSISESGVDISDVLDGWSTEVAVPALPAHDEATEDA